MSNPMAFVPVKRVKASDKRYDLFYRGQLLCSNVHYTVCNARKTALAKDGNHCKDYFTIKLHP